jgi:dipeptidyl aminopeptidase/acylaminoacyl peptidase
MRFKKCLGVMVLVGLLVNSAAAADNEHAVPKIPIVDWLALGPVLQPMPALGADTQHADLTEAVLDAPILPPFARLPAPGDSLRWSTGEEISWQVVKTDGSGQLNLLPPAQTRTGQASVAWLATTLSTERYCEVVLELGLDHPATVVLDGEKVEAGAGGGGWKLALAPGDHLLVVETVLDPTQEGPWRVDASLEGPLAHGVRSSTSAARDLGILDIVDAQKISSFDLSPEGKEVLLSMSSVRTGSGTAEHWLELRATSDGRLLRSWRGAPAPAEVRWAPTGRRFAYVTREGESKKASLWLADLESGSTRAIVNDVEQWGSYRWSPTGEVIVFSTVDKPEENERGIKRLRGLLDRMADYRETATLHLVTVADGVRRPLTDGPPSATAAAFSPDGGRLLVTREVEDLSQRPYTRIELWELDLRTGEAEKLRDFRWLQRVEYAPDGRRLLVLAGPSSFGGAGLDLPEGVIANDFDGQLYIWDPRSGEVDAITRDFDPAVFSTRWSPYDGAIYLAAIDGDCKHIFRYEEVSRTFSLIETGLESVESFATARRAATVAVTGTSVWQPQRLVILDGSGEPPRTLVEPAADRFRQVRRGEVKTWTYTTASGRAVPGRVYLPTGFDEKRSYPAIVNYYAGTSPIERSFGGRYPAEWWAANGYVVYVVNPVGAYGRGQASSAVHVNDWGEQSGVEIIAASKGFLEAHPFVDPKRIGCIGASYGGFETMSLLTRTDIFAAAVAHAGISALSSYWGEGYWGYSYGAVANAGSFPWNRPDVFVDRSPLFHADRVTTPLLLTQGDADTNVPLGESDQFYAALKLLGAEVEYLRVAGLGHLIMEHDKRVLWSESILAWFDRWLKNQPEWWDALYPEP